MCLEILTDNVVSHETQHFVDVNFLDDVPKPFDNILYTFLANALQSTDKWQWLLWLFIDVAVAHLAKAAIRQSMQL